MDTKMLIQKLADLFPNQGEVQDSCFYFTACRLSVHPEVINRKENLLSLGFKLSCPDWDRDIYETCTGIGGEEKALGLALASFFLGVIDGLKKIFRAAGTPFCDCDCSGTIIDVETHFLDTSHRWKMGRSSVVCMGETPKSEVDYWSVLKDDLIARLGNQKIFAVRIFVAKSGDTCTGECRINNTIVDDLSEKLRVLAESWTTKSYGSHKQYILFLQDDSTYAKCPYGVEDVGSGVNLAIETLSAMGEEDDYSELANKLTAAGVDPSLAEDIAMFLPEMCAEKAFPTLKIAEELIFGAEPVFTTVYKSQHASYHPILEALDDQFYYKKVSQPLFQRLVLQSSLYGCVLQIEQAEGSIENIGDCSVKLTFQPSDLYRLR